MTRKLILDVDTGTDDAVAIMLAALHPGLDLVACTTANGNVEVHHCTDNSLRVLDFIGRSDIPVHEGLARPLARSDFPIPRAQKEKHNIHGTELPIPPAKSRKREKRAVEFLIETYRAATEAIALVPVGPLSNIGAALAVEPRFAELVPEIVIMGGAHQNGNVTASAEFNIWADPEAAAMVFAAGFRKITLVPLDATHQAVVSLAQCDALEALGTPAGIASARFVRHRIQGYAEIQPMERPDIAPVHDALCVASLIAPEVITTKRAHVAVETQGALTVGRTVIDVRRRSAHLANCSVAFGADAALFNQILYDTFRVPAGRGARG